MKLLLLVALALPAAAQFEFARLNYADRAGAFYPGNGSKAWNTDYSDGTGLSAEQHLLPLLELNTTIESPSASVTIPVLQFLARTPFVYTVEPEQLSLTAGEAAALREWLARGGFWVMDDFHGCSELAHVRAELAKVFAGEGPVFVSLSPTHKLFHMIYDVEWIVQVPVVSTGVMFGVDPNWPTSEFGPPCDQPEVLLWEGERDGSILLAYNTDLGDGLEHANDPDYPMKFSKYSYQFLTNTIAYALTH